MDATKKTLDLVSAFNDLIPAFEINPGAHQYTIWQCGLMAGYGTVYLREYGLAESNSQQVADADKTLSLCRVALSVLLDAGKVGENPRLRNLTNIHTLVFPNPHRREAWSTTGSPDQRGGNVDSFASLSATTGTPQLHGLFSNASVSSQTGTMSPLSHLLNPTDEPPPTLSRTTTSPALSDTAAKDLATQQRLLNLDFSTNFIHPYERLGLAVAPVKDIWDEPVFADAPAPASLPAAVLPTPPAVANEAGMQVRGPGFAGSGLPEILPEVWSGAGLGRQTQTQTRGGDGEGLPKRMRLG
jgi:hypothetical protein